MARTRKRTSGQSISDWGAHDHAILVLQGGGALGAYQAGVYDRLASSGIEPDWVAGVSIGAINCTLIAGNPPERRIERLREFWERMSAWAPVVLPPEFEMMRPVMNQMSAASAIMFGIGGFFVPRLVVPYIAPEGTPGALSFYDTQPLKATLEDLADFDLINQGKVRLSLGAVNVRTGESVYFDSRTTVIRPEHVIASAALPPGFPPVEVDGELYWDGGIVSNTPLQYVLDDFRIDALIFQVDVFSAVGDVPQNLHQVQERAKDIQYASKQRLSTERIKEIEALRTTLAEVLKKLPKTLQSDPGVKRLAAISTRGALSLVHLVNRHKTHSSEFKDYEFSRATVTNLWEGGHDDAGRMIDHPEACTVTEICNGVRIYQLTS
jgi:NTE family protein